MPPPMVDLMQPQVYWFLDASRKKGGLGQKAAFRKGQECVAQVVARKEIILRRNIKWWKATYVAFIDFKKAYDMVPHEVLMKKLRVARVAGKALDFFKNLYFSTSVKVRFEDLVTPPITIQRGVRQGCPTSPSLFNIFINDIMDGLKALGVEVLGISDVIAGLLFADDLVLFAKYLGLEVDSKLSIKRMVKERGAVGKKALFGMRHFLVDKRIPTWAKVLALKALVHPCLTFGTESVNSTAVGVAVLHQELNVCPIATFNVGQRARGFFKCRGLKTSVADLVKFPSAYRVGEKWTWKAWESKHSTKTLKFYKEFKLEGLREFFKRAMRYEDVTPEKVRLLILARLGGCLLVKRVVRLGLVDHRIGVRSGEWLTNVANDDKCRLALLLGGEIGGRLCNLLRDRPHWRGTAGDRSQLVLVEGPSGSDTTFEPTPEKPGWVYLILWRIPRVTETKSESSWPMRILQAMLEHGSLISSGRAFEP
eukprot:Gb_03256 [translate_table: standard]